jgi:hypothetical protein
MKQTFLINLSMRFRSKHAPSDTFDADKYLRGTKVLIRDDKSSSIYNLKKKKFIFLNKTTNTYMTRANI